MIIIGIENSIVYLNLSCFLTNASTRIAFSADAPKATGYARVIKGSIVRTFYQYRSLLVPVLSAILSLLWLIFDLSFEPVITLIASISASLVVFYQIKKDWKQRTDNLLYTVQIRSPDLKKIDSCVKEILESDPAIIKWKIYHLDGEFKDLIIESIHKLDHKFVLSIVLKNECKPYRFSLGDEIIWETQSM